MFYQRQEQIQMSDNKKWKPFVNFAQSTVSTTFLTMSAYKQRRQCQTNPTQFMSSSAPFSAQIASSNVGPQFIINSSYDKQLSGSNIKQKYNSFVTGKLYSTIVPERTISPVKRGQNYNQSQRQAHKKVQNNNGNSKPNDNDCNFSKIMEKINKKQQLINQLRELTKVSVSDIIKNKTKRFDVPNKQYYSESDKNKQGSESAKVKISFRRSVPDYKQLSSNQFTPLQLKIPRQVLKNPEQTSDLHKAKNGYLTHRQAQSKKTQNTSILGYSSVQNSIVVVKQKKPIDKKSINYTVASQSSEKPRLTPRGQQAKNIQQMRLRRTKNNSIYFTNKLTSIYQFYILKTLGQGKFGKVYQAIHKTTNSIYAIKKIEKKVIKESMMIEQLIKQVKIQSYCKHENILQLYGMFDDQQFIYLVLEYMEEGTLFNELKRRRILSQKQAAIKLKQLAKAIVYLHDKGIAHRDIKPQNIVMTNGVGKLCDFGWATLCLDERRLTYCGTFDYAAPQILQGAQYDMSVDLWCLGILAYEIMVGKAPFYHISRKQTMKRIINVENQSIKYPPSLSKEAVSFIQSLIRKTPQQRMNGVNILIHPFLLKVQQ